METSAGETFKPDMDATLLRCFMYLLVLNAPFLGLYRAAATGELQPDLYPFMAAGVVALAASLVFCRRFLGIRYGWNETHVFKQGVFKYTEIPWSEIRKIYETGIAQEWTEGLPALISIFLLAACGTEDAATVSDYVVTGRTPGPSDQKYFQAIDIHSKQATPILSIQETTGRVYLPTMSSLPECNGKVIQGYISEDTVLVTTQVLRDTTVKTVGR